MGGIFASVAGGHKLGLRFIGAQAPVKNMDQNIWIRS
jgi:hypothetical protein